jgi:anti-sigma regulatory factor (Ser/Thr protein kinase)
MTTAATDLRMPELGALLAPAAPDSGIRRNDCLSTPSGQALRSRPECRVFPGRPEQVACARRFISQVLTRCPAVADAVLLTSELVTNTLRHTITGAGGHFEVIACHGQGGIRVTVTDDGSGAAPALLPRATLATSGRGLALVGALAARWGHQGSERGRAVWFELDCQ